MQFYRVTCGKRPPKFAATLREAHKFAKATPDDFETVVDLVAVATDRAAVIELMRSCFDPDYPDPIVNVLRTWELTPRRGLKEIKP